MSAETQYATSQAPASGSKAMVWVGRVISALPVLLLLFSASIKFAQPPEAMKGFVEMGYPERLALTLGVVELTCTVLYVIPQTAVLGAILLTGYLGGATATHVRVDGPLFNILFPVVFGALLWAGLYLREERLRALLPLRK